MNPAELKEIMEAALAELGDAPLVTYRSMFGGMGAYAGNGIFGSLYDGGIGLKLGQKEFDELIKLGGKPLQYEPSMPPSKAYVVTPLDWYKPGSPLGDWIMRSIAYVKTLPTKPKKK